MSNQENEMPVREFINHLKAYVALRSDLIVLQFKKVTATVISSLASSLTILLFSFFSFLFGSIALALYLGELTGSAYKGFICVALLYLLLSLLFYICRKVISNSISSIIIKQLFKPDEDEANS